MKDTKPLLIQGQTDFPSIKRLNTEILQVNLGYTCNLSCTHCHVNAGPNRTEQMSLSTAKLVLKVVDAQKVKILDLTGGAPELNPHFRMLVKEASKRGVKVIDRCNLTVLNEPGQEELAEFLAKYRVEVCASLPCYSGQRVDAQRGNGTFESSIKGLKKLNSLGYGREDSGLLLNLVYNPQGPSLPPPQTNLELDYKRELKEQFGIVFNNLLTITNMPIQRFGAVLLSKGKFQDYMSLLKDNFSWENLNGLMCRQLISVDWQGYLYDCDFNQMLKIEIGADFQNHSERGSGADRKSGKMQIVQGHFRPHLNDLLKADLPGQTIAVADHCYGCAAGQGSSCGGALDDK